MKKPILAFLYVLLFSSTSFSYTAFYSGSELQEMCKTSQTECSLLIIGSLDGINLTQGNHPDEREICLPPAITIGQVRQVVVKHMTDHPERLHLPAAALVFESMSTAFPCAE
jgi:hypothetical protein